MHGGAMTTGGADGPSPQSVALDDSGYATRTFCSWNDGGWRTSLLRCLDNQAEGEVGLPAVPDQLVVLVTGGCCVIESRNGRRWTKATYTPGRLGMTAPGNATRIRWRTRGADPHTTEQVYLPGRLMTDRRAGL